MSPRGKSTERCLLGIVQRFAKPERPASNYSQRVSPGEEPVPIVRGSPPTGLFQKEVGVRTLHLRTHGIPISESESFLGAILHIHNPDICRTYALKTWICFGFNPEFFGQRLRASATCADATFDRLQRRVAMREEELRRPRLRACVSPSQHAFELCIECSSHNQQL